MADEPLPQSGIYRIRNIVSGRIYVGSAIKIASRWAQHRSSLRKGHHHSRILQRSWAKHGETAFAFEVLEAVADVTELIKREQFWIDHLQATSPTRGFNAYPIAGSPLGTKATAETRAKQSAAQKGKKKPPRSTEHCEKIAAARRLLPKRKYKPRTPEHAARIGAAKLGKKRSLASRLNQSLATKGRRISDQHLPLHRSRLVARNKRRSTGDLTHQLPLPMSE